LTHKLNKPSTVALAARNAFVTKQSATVHTVTYIHICLGGGLREAYARETATRAFGWWCVENLWTVEPERIPAFGCGVENLSQFRDADV